MTDEEYAFIAAVVAALGSDVLTMPADAAAVASGLAAAPTVEPAPRYIAKSCNRYSVIVEGSVVRYYDTIGSAIGFARSAVFLAAERVGDMEALLGAGKIAEWSYGFSSVAVYPPTDGAKAEVERLTNDAAAFTSCNRARQAAEAEVARLASVATEACDVADRAIGDLRNDERRVLRDGERIARLRASIPAPDPAAFVAAVDAYGRAERDCNVSRGGKATEIRNAARAALLALGGGR